MKPQEEALVYVANMKRSGILSLIHSRILCCLPATGDAVEFDVIKNGSGVSLKHALSGLSKAHDSGLVEIIKAPETERWGISETHQFRATPKLLRILGLFEDDISSEAVAVIEGLIRVGARTNLRARILITIGLSGNEVALSWLKSTTKTGEGSISLMAITLLEKGLITTYTKPTKRQGFDPRFYLATDKLRSAIKLEGGMS
jgi:hypothetical protein